MKSVVEFPHLFEPISIGNMLVKNRLVMPAMGTGFATPEGLITQQSLDYYEARAKGGYGMVIVETASVDFPRGIYASNRLVVDNDAVLPGLTALANIIKSNGAKAVMQLNHAGRLGKSRVTGIQPVAPSAIPAPGGEMPRALETHEIPRIVELFALAALRAKRAGFDGVELHAAHGYLLATFSSPHSNKRTDQYGGSVENRGRLLVEVLTAIRKLVGEEFPVWGRINGQEFGDDNVLSLEDGQNIARMIDGLANAISVSARGYGLSSLVNYPDDPGALFPIAAAIKSVVSVPIIAVGRMNAEVGERLISEGKIDMMALGRQSIADPETPNKIKTGNLVDIRPCIACFYCSDAGLKMDKAIGCQVNAAIGKEKEYAIRPANKFKKIVVVGSGPAGLEASRVLALRGHDVTIFEKDNYLGGQLYLATLPPEKERLAPLVRYFEHQLVRLKVTIKLGSEANIQSIRDLKPDVVVVATGSNATIPPIPCVNLPKVFTPKEILNGATNLKGKRVVVVGAGSTGCETADYIYEQGAEITVIEMSAGIALEAGGSDRTRMMNRLNTLPIQFLTSTRCLEITNEGVRIADAGNAESLLSADIVVLAVGVRPNNQLFQAIHAEGIEVHMAGDCWHSGQIARAVADGARIGHLL